MGKSELLKKLAKHSEHPLVTARQLINRADLQSLVDDGSTILIDALDEVPSRAVGDAVDLVLQKLGQIGCPRFILSCRVADWRSATSAAAISEQYEERPLELHLEELDRDEQIRFLSVHVGDACSQELVEHFSAFGLEGLLGNPQTLDLIRRLPLDQALPSTRTALFELAVEELRKEHRDGGPELAKTDLLATAGAAFAGLILGGKTFASRRSAANLEEDEASLTELKQLCSDKLEIALDTRLFRAAGNDRFSFCHKLIGEFLGAAWLAKKADTRRKRKRLLELFSSRGLVPANLRGLHAWLARDQKLALEVIETDPMGLIEYGDADGLPPEQGNALFDALELLASKNPWFKNWHQVRATALVAEPLRERAQKVLLDRNAPFHLRAVIADQLNEVSVASRFRGAAIAILFDGGDDIYLRRKAAEAVALLNDENFSAHLEALLSQGTRASAKIAYEFIEIAGVEHFSDDQVIRAVLAHDGLIFCEVPRKPQSTSLLGFWRFEERVPVERLDGLLETLTHYTSALLKEHAGIDENQLIDFAYGLILRRLNQGTVDPLKLWEWLKPFSKQDGYHRDHEKALATWFKEHADERRAIQRHVLFDARDHSINYKGYRLSRSSASLYPSEADVAYLLGQLDPEDRNSNKWRELLSLVRHDGEEGQLAREAAKPFVLNNPEMLDWLDRLAIPNAPEWQVKQERRRRKEERKRAARYQEHRRDYLLHIDDVREGTFGSIHGPAQAYLKMFRDIGDNLKPNERIAEWLGEDVARAALDGFEQFLMRKPTLVTATRIAVSYAKATQWNATNIIVAALAERLRTRCEPFEGVTDERLMAGLFRVWFSRIDDHAGFPELQERLEAELLRRGALGRAFRLFIVPQLKKRKDHVDQLYPLMRSKQYGDLATSMAVEWLQACPDLPTGPEMELVDRLVSSGRLDELRSLVAIRLSQDLDDERRRSWDAIQVYVDFEGAVDRLTQPLQPELLWHLRARIGGGRSDKRPMSPLSSAQRTWIVSSFRKLWPNRLRPEGASSGDQNYWDASDYLKKQISLLGEDTDEQAREGLACLKGEPEDEYTDYIRVVIAEQQQKLAEQTYRIPSLDEICTILEGGQIVDQADLRAVMLDALQDVQAKLKGDPVDWYKGFFSDDGTKHRDEEACRDEIIKMLQTVEPSLEYIPESHAADDKRVDIVARARSKIILPIEIKGQWHSKIWTAADKQLDILYSNDWRAEHGIYLVLWFGPNEKLKPPPNGAKKPSTPTDLADALFANSKAAQEDRVSIVVLDLTRPASC
ncbi:NACHT domain-containing protein [Alteriqipengyuania sp. 357]